MFDVTTGQASQVAQHDAPIKVVGWVDAPGAGILATGSWDKTVKVTNPPFSATLLLPPQIWYFCSIGISAVPLRWLQYNFQKDVTHSISSIPYS